MVARVGPLPALGWEVLAKIEGIIDKLIEDSGEITERELEMIVERIEGERSEMSEERCEMSEVRTERTSTDYTDSTDCRGKE